MRDWDLWVLGTVAVAGLALLLFAIATMMLE